MDVSPAHGSDGGSDQTASSARQAAAPLPPVEFAHRVGCAPGDRCLEQYVAVGARMRAEIQSMLPGGWTWDGKRVLDFGCGAGRLLRHFLAEAEVAELHGSDVDGEMVGWLRANLCPPITSASVNGKAPPLRQPDSAFDLILATSVFTHISDEWSAWLLEMRRLLKPDGLLLATFLGSGMSELIAREPWEPDRIAMNPLDAMAHVPSVMHSEWWLREHWGRAFEFLELRGAGFAVGARAAARGVGQGSMLLRPKQVSLSTEDLEREAPGDERYEVARRHHKSQLEAERMRREGAVGDQAASRWRHRVGRVGHAFRRRPQTSPAGQQDAWLEPILVDHASHDGSTLLMRLLATSGQIAIEPPYPFERRYLAYLLRWARLLDRGDWPSEAWSTKDLGSLAQEHHGAMLGPPPWSSRPFLESGSGQPSMSTRCFEFAWREFSRRAIAATRTHHQEPEADVRYYAEKHQQTWELDSRELPPFRQIILVRDPRDIYTSIRGSNENGPASTPIGQNPSEPPRDWRRRFLLTQKARLQWIARVLSEGEVPVIRYEDLVSDLPGQARRLEDWLSVTLRPEDVKADTRFWDAHSSSQSPEISIGRWRTEMRPGEVRLFERRLGDDLRAIGFEG